MSRHSFSFFGPVILQLLVLSLAQSKASTNVSKDVSENENVTCVDVIPPLFSEDVNCGSLVNALKEGCDSSVLSQGNYCSGTCGRNPCRDPLSELLYKASKNPIDTDNIGYGAPALWLDNFVQERDILHMVDINGDKLDDLVAFGDRGVYVSLSAGNYFEKPELWSREFGSSSRAGEWSLEIHPRQLADVNSDGLKDIVGFYNDGVYVALNDGSKFEDAELWILAYGVDKGWLDHPRFLVDMNDDGIKDIVGLANEGTVVSLANNSMFLEHTNWIRWFGKNKYNTTLNPVHIVDVSGDGFPDILGFADQGVELAISTGVGFAPQAIVLDAFSSFAGWRSDRHLRFVEDIDNDGYADIIGMGDGGVLVSLSTGEGFDEPMFALGDFGYYAGSWRLEDHVRLLADMDGDGYKDIVGFKDKGVLVAFNDGYGEFEEPLLVVNWFGADMSAGGWTIANNPRFVGDVNGDGKADIVGVAIEGVYVSLSITK